MRFFIAITLFVLASFASAQEWTMNLYYGAGAKQTAYVTSKKFGQVDNVFGTKSDLDVDAFFGAFADGAPVTGFMLGKRFKAADNATVYVGAGPVVAQGRAIDWGFGFGISWKR